MGLTEKIKEIEEDLQLEAGRVRKPGGGRKAKQTEDSTLLSDLQRSVEPATRGDPMRVLVLHFRFPIRPAHSFRSAPWSAA